MATQEQRILQDTAALLTDLLEGLNEVEEWADDEGYTAIAHKLQEAYGRINSAADAATQYSTGELTRRE